MTTTKKSPNPKLLPSNDPVAELNKWQVNIGQLRMFLASLVQDGEEEIPAGALVTAMKSFARKGTGVRASDG